MIRKIAMYTFAAAVLTVFAMGTSFAEGNKDKARQDRSTMPQDRSDMSRDRSTTTQDRTIGTPGTSGMTRDRSARDRSDMAGKKVSLDLNPAQRVSTEAKGETEFEFRDDGKTLVYKIEVDKIKDVTQAHVHMVKPDGSAGEVIAPLFPVRGTGALPSGERTDVSRGAREGEMKEGEFSGKLTEGSLTDQHLTGSMKGKSTQDLYEMLRTGKAGVNVHTKANPVGEIWGTTKANAGSDRK